MKESMDLRELKKEVQKLPDIYDNLEQFQQHWFKPFKKDAISKFNFLKNIDPITRRDINQKLAEIQPHIDQIKSSGQINEKLRRHANQLIELKLTSINGDRKRSKMLSNSMLKDEVLSLGKTINEVKSFEENLMKLSENYEDINELLHKNLSLEETVFFMDLPHKLYLYNLINTAKEHKKIVRDLGQHFVAINKEMSLKKVPHK